MLAYPFSQSYGSSSDCIHLTLHASSVVRRLRTMDHSTLFHLNYFNHHSHEVGGIQVGCADVSYSGNVSFPPHERLDAQCKACLSSSLSVLEIINFSGDCKGKINGNHERWGALCGLIRFLILRFGFV